MLHSKSTSFIYSVYPILVRGLLKIGKIVFNSILFSLIQYLLNAYSTLDNTMDRAVKKTDKIFPLGELVFSTLREVKRLINY